MNVSDSPASRPYKQTGKITGAAGAVAGATRPGPAQRAGVMTGCQQTAAFAALRADRPCGVAHRRPYREGRLPHFHDQHQAHACPHQRPMPDSTVQEIRQGQSECSWCFNARSNHQAHIVGRLTALQHGIFVTVCQRRVAPYSAGCCGHAKSTLLQINCTYANSGNPPQQNSCGR